MSLSFCLLLKPLQTSSHRCGDDDHTKDDEEDEEDHEEDDVNDDLQARPMMLW